MNEKTKKTLVIENPAADISDFLDAFGVRSLNQCCPIDNTSLQHILVELDRLSKKEEGRSGYLDAVNNHDRPTSLTELKYDDYLHRYVARRIGDGTIKLQFFGNGPNRHGGCDWPLEGLPSGSEFEWNPNIGPILLHATISDFEGNVVFENVKTPFDTYIRHYKDGVPTCVERITDVDTMIEGPTLQSGEKLPEMHTGGHSIARYHLGKDGKTVIAYQHVSAYGDYYFTEIKDGKALNERKSRSTKGSLMQLVPAQLGGLKGRDF